MAKEYYGQSYSVAGQNTSLNQAPLIGSKKKYLFLYPTLCFVMVLKWLFRKNTQSSPSWTVEVSSHNPWYVSWVAVLFRNCSATKPMEPMCTMRRRNFKVRKLLFLFTFVPTVYKGQFSCYIMAPRLEMHLSSFLMGAVSLIIPVLKKQWYENSFIHKYSLLGKLLHSFRWFTRDTDTIKQQGSYSTTFYKRGKPGMVV